MISHHTGANCVVIFILCHHHHHLLLLLLLLLVCILRTKKRGEGDFLSMQLLMPMLMLMFVLIFVNSKPAIIRNWKACPITAIQYIGSTYVYFLLFSMAMLNPSLSLSMSLYWLANLQQEAVEVSAARPAAVGHLRHRRMRQQPPHVSGRPRPRQPKQQQLCLPPPKKKQHNSSRPT